MFLLLAVDVARLFPILFFSRLMLDFQVIGRLKPIWGLECKYPIYWLGADHTNAPSFLAPILPPVLLLSRSTSVVPFLLQSDKMIKRFASFQNIERLPGLFDNGTKVPISTTRHDCRADSSFSAATRERWAFAHRVHLLPLDGTAFRCTLVQIEWRI